jgi:hypothetical protein
MDEQMKSTVLESKMDNAPQMESTKLRPTNVGMAQSILFGVIIIIVLSVFIYVGYLVFTQNAREKAFMENYNQRVEEMQENYNQQVEKIKKSK